MFEIGRTDGRSNQQVLLDHVKGHEPGRTYSYEELTNVLQEGSPRTFDKDAVRQVVLASASRLSKEQQRALNNIRNVGYCLAKASEHSGMALTKKRRADNQLKRGVQLLRNVRWEEMDSNQRQMHEGVLLIVGGLYEQQAAFDKRLQRVEDVIRATIRQ